MDTRTQCERVLSRMREVGYVDNVWAVENRILRLAARINDLKGKPWCIELDEERTGFPPGSKVYRYYLKRKEGQAVLPL